MRQISIKQCPNYINGSKLLTNNRCSITGIIFRNFPRLSLTELEKKGPQVPKQSEALSKLNFMEF